MVTPSVDPRRTEVAPLVERGDADRALSIPALGELHPNTAFEDRGDLVAEGADQAATVLECREPAGELSPRLVVFLGSASLVGGCA